MTRDGRTSRAIALGMGGNHLLGPWFSLAGLLLGVWMAGCHKPASTADTPATEVTATEATKPVEIKVSAGAPKIVVEKDTCDLGEVGTDTKHKGQFKFTNAGQSTLRINQVVTCCGVVVKGVKDGQEYAPGEKGVLEFEYQMGSLPSATMVRKLYLQTNDPAQNVVPLNIKLTIVRRVECKPERMSLFLRKENAGCQDITLKSLDGKPFSIKAVKATADSITADFDPSVKATEFTLKPKADLEKLKTNPQGYISIDLTHPECSNARLLYDVLPEFVFSPPNIMAFGLKAGEPVQRDIWLLRNYQEGFEIESVSSEKGTVKLVEKTKVDYRYLLKIEITPPPQEARGAMLADTLRVKIKDGEMLTVTLRGFYP